MGMGLLVIGLGGLGTGRAGHRAGLGTGLGGGLARTIGLGGGLNLGACAMLQAAIEVAD